MESIAKAFKYLFEYDNTVSYGINDTFRFYEIDYYDEYIKQKLMINITNKQKEEKT